MMNYSQHDIYDITLPVVVDYMLETK